LPVEFIVFLFEISVLVIMWEK